MKVVIGENQYTIEFMVNSLCELERVARANLGEVLSLPKYTMFRYMIWAGLLKHHDVTIEQAGELVEQFLTENDESELVQAITGAISEAGFIGAQGKKKAK